MKAVVTGATSGIGLELTRILCAERKATVLGVGRSVDKLSELESAYGGCFVPVKADLSSPEGVEIVASEARNKLGEIDLLVNNAGFGLYKKLLGHSEEEVYSMINTNFVAPIVLTKKLAPYMKSGSTVVFVVTAGVHVLLRSLPLYGASKIGLHYAVKALRHELEEKGINVLAVYPGAVKTRFHERGGRTIKKGAEPGLVAREIMKAVDKRRKELYVPRYLALAKALSCFLPVVEGPAGD